MNPVISDFVRDALSRGISREEIRQALETGGWEPKEINTALDAFVESSLSLPVPRKRVSSSPKEAFLFLMQFAALYTAAFALGSVLFDLVNLVFPAPGEVAMNSVVSLRYGIASVVVAFPLFLSMCRVIARENLRNPGQRISPVRRWLTYMTLFVSAVSIVADLITLLVRFLEGDVTLRFGLKVLIVAVLAGSAFLYYLRDLRRDEAGPAAASRPSRGVRLGLAALVVAVAATVAAGFWYAGSPMKARLEEQDRQRIRDLAAICHRVERYYANQGSLPQSLADCDVNPETHIARKADRVTGDPYFYKVADATHFQLGAVFALPGRPGMAPVQYGKPGALSPEDEGFWAHDAGFQLFHVDATRKTRR